MPKYKVSVSFNSDNVEINTDDYAEEMTEQGIDMNDSDAVEEWLEEGIRENPDAFGIEMPMIEDVGLAKVPVVK